MIKLIDRTWYFLFILAQQGVPDISNVKISGFWTVFYFRDSVQCRPSSNLGIVQAKKKVGDSRTRLPNLHNDVALIPLFPHKILASVLDCVLLANAFSGAHPCSLFLLSYLLSMSKNATFTTTTKQQNKRVFWTAIILVMPPSFFVHALSSMKNVPHTHASNKNHTNRYRSVTDHHTTVRATPSVRATVPPRIYTHTVFHACTTHVYDQLLKNRYIWYVDDSFKKKSWYRSSILVLIVVISS